MYAERSVLLSLVAAACAAGMLAVTVNYVFAQRPGRGGAAGQQGPRGPQDPRGPGIADQQRGGQGQCQRGPGNPSGPPSASPGNQRGPGGQVRQTGFQQGPPPNNFGPGRGGFGPPQQFNGPPQQGFGPAGQGFGPPSRGFGPPRQFGGPPRGGFNGPPQGFNGPPQGPPQGFNPRNFGGPPQGIIDRGPGGPPQGPQFQNRFGQRMPLGPQGHRPGPPRGDDRGQFRGPPPHPLISAIDADGNGRLSAEELSGAAAALKGLDANEDGELDDAELHPFGPPPHEFHRPRSVEEETEKEDREEP